MLVAHGLDVVQHLCRHRRAVDVDDLLEDRLQLLLAGQEVDLEL